MQLGLVEERPAKVTKPLAGHYKKANVPPTRVRREVKVKAGGEPLKAGDQVLVASIFNAGERVDVIGTSRGHGFQGVVKRHNFRGGAATHGSMFHRAPGSIGASSYPSRVVKGMRAAGHMGDERVTTRNLRVVRVDAEQQPADGARGGAGRRRRLRDHPQGRGGQARAQAPGREADQGRAQERRQEEVGRGLGPAG